MALLSIASCVTRSPVTLTVTAPVAVPLLNRDYFLFEHDRAQLCVHDVAPTAAVDAPPPAIGDPVAVALDLTGAWAGVAYGERLASIQLADRHVMWSKDALAEPVRSFCVAGDRAAVVHDKSIECFRLPKFDPLWREDFGAWLGKSHLDTANFILPQSDNAFLIVGTVNKTGFHEGRVEVQRVDRSKSPWDCSAPSVIPGLQLLDSCVSDGKSLYLAGTHEEAVRFPQPLQVTFLIVRVDPKTLAPSEIVASQRFDSLVKARHIAVGKDLVAVAFSDGNLEVYRLLKEGRTSAPVFGPTKFGRDFTVAWLSDDDVLVVGAGAPQIVHVQR